MRKKPAFTLPELLMASGIFGMILAAGMSLIALMTANLYDGQIESTNRTSLNETIFYLTREIQSAEKVVVKDSGKTLEVTQRGSQRPLRYSICAHYPVGYLAFSDKRQLDVDYEKSMFAVQGNTLLVTLGVLKNNVEPDQRAQVISFHITPRSTAAMEVG